MGLAPAEAAKHGIAVALLDLACATIVPDSADEWNVRSMRATTSAGGEAWSK